MTANNSKDRKDNIIDLGFTAKPVPPVSLRIGQWLTLRNIVLALGAETFLIFIGSVVSARIAFLFASLMGLAVALMFEISARRGWERQMVSQMGQMAQDYERLVREVARNRNDMIVLKKNLADAGALARSYGAMPGGAPGTAAAVEQRMLKALADQLARIDERVEEKPGPDLRQTELDLSAITVAPGAAPENIGRNLSDKQVLQIVQTAVQQDRIDLFLQPIVALPQRAFQPLRRPRDLACPHDAGPPAQLVQPGR